MSARPKQPKGSGFTAGRCEREADRSLEEEEEEAAKEEEAEEWCTAQRNASSILHSDLQLLQRTSLAQNFSERARSTNTDSWGNHPGKSEGVGGRGKKETLMRDRTATNSILHCMFHSNVANACFASLT